jgi:hypothetical protein
MKKTIFVMTLATIFLGTGLTSCNTSAENVEDAQENVDEANEKLDEANEEYVEDLLAYRTEIAERISINEVRIADLKVIVAAEKGEMKVNHEKQIAELEKRNRDLKNKMDSYKGDGRDDWNEFKKEFNHDMDELGKALTDLTVSNTK